MFCQESTRSQLSLNHRRGARALRTLIGVGCIVAVGCGGDGGGDAAKGQTQASSAEAPFIGNWEEQHAEKGYESFMVLEAGGKGYLCAADDKSQADFSVSYKNNQGIMGDYGYGTGDTLVLDAAHSALTRTGTDHDEKYVVNYAAAKTLPDWCTQQIAELKGEANAKPSTETSPLTRYIGVWHKTNSDPGYDAYMMLNDQSGLSYLCNQDGKSQAEFDLVVDGDSVSMGDYGFGSGDELTLDDSGKQLTRTGSDHDEVYTESYVSVSAAPDWCTKQIAEMMAGN